MKEYTGSVDIPWLLKNVGGNETLVCRLLEMFRDSLAGSLEEIRACYKAGDRAALSRRVHSLKGTAATVGAREVCSVAAELETLLQDAPLDELVNGIDHLARCCESAGKEIENYIQAGL